MPTNNRNQLFDIESKLNAKFDPDKRVLLFDSRYYDVRHHVVNRKLSKYTTGDCISVSGFNVNADILLEQISLNEKNSEGAIQEGSTYGQLCEKLMLLKRGVIHVYEAHKLSREALHLLSQIIRYCKKHMLNWRFVLTGNLSWIDGKRFMPLSIDRLYARKESSYEYRKIATNNYAANPSVFSLSRINPLSLVLTLGIFVALGLILLKPNQMDEPEDTLNSSPQSQAKHIESELSTNSDNQELDTYLQVLEQKEIAFNKQIKEFTEAQMTTSVPREHKPNVPVREKAVTIAVVPATPQAARNSNKTPQSSPTKNVPTAKMSSQLVLALKAFDAQKLNALYKSGEPLNGVDDLGQSALIYAVITKRPKLVSFLLDTGVPTEIKDQQGHTALFYAAVIGNTSAAKQLLRNGARVDTRSKLLKTPLMAATHNGHSEVVEILIAANADVNQRDHSGWSPLFFATWNNNLELVNKLLTSGANRTHRDNDGYTVEAIANLRGNKLLAKALTK